LAKKLSEGPQIDADKTQIHPCFQGAYVVLRNRALRLTDSQRE